ncbi:MAG TPA: NADH-quinone oxidoreductase subunit M [Solirubrobacteraceae bacterium]|nr:NADH-quinone oxidoreductase subunit M [Solirubrobacteraceae bacterium]
MIDTTQSWLATSLWLLPLASALVVGVVPWPRRVAGTLALAAAFAEAALVAVALVRFDETGGIQFEQRHAWVRDLGLTYHVGMDGLSLVLVALLAFVLPWALVYALWEGRDRLRGYLGLMLLLEAAVALLFVARDLALFYVGFETMLIPLAVLMAIWGGANRVRATLRFVIYTLVGSLLMLVCIITLGVRAGTFDLAGVGSSGSTWLFLGFMVAFAIKAPLYPLHGWVPDAYRESPPEVAALLSGVISKAGAYGMLRFALPLFPGPAADWRVPLIALSLVGLLWGSLVAFRQPDSRGVIAYSSIAQMSLIVLGIFVLNDAGGTGATFQMVNHGLLSALLFLIAGLVERRFGTGLFARIGALAHGRPALATLCITTGVAALAVPGSSLFASEFLVLLGAFRRYWLVGALASIAIVLAAMYMLRWISALLHDPVEDRTLRDAVSDPARYPDVRWEAVYIVPFVAAVLALSVQPYLVTHRVTNAVHALTAPAAREVSP